MKVTMKTIASEVGTSIATVSLALADHPRVNDDTKERVRQASLRLGYCTPSELAARSQRGSRDAELPKPLVKFLVLGGRNRLSVASEVLSPLMGLPSQLGMRLELDGLVEGPDAVPGAKPHADAATLDWLRVHAVEAQALILHGVVPPEVIPVLTETGTPTVTIGPIPGPLPEAATLRLRSVGYDEVGAGRRATQALLDLGHRRIALVTARGTAGLYYDRWEDGYRLALSRAGIPCDERLIDRRGDRITGAPGHPFYAVPGGEPTAYVVPDPSHLDRAQAVVASSGGTLSPGQVVLGGTLGSRQSSNCVEYPAIYTDASLLVSTALRQVSDLLAASPGPILTVQLPHLSVHLDRLMPPTNA